MNIENSSTTDYLGPDFIGQSALRKKVNFLLDSYKKKPFLDSLLFVAKRGDGKTKICRKIAKILNKKAIEINGASFQSVTDFVDQIINPHVVGNQDVTLFIDEISAINPKVVEWLLSMLAYDSETKLSSASHQGNTYNFNFNHLTVLTATTNPESLSEPFRSRFRRLEFGSYSDEELVQILKFCCPNIEFADHIEKDIVSVSRGSPREITLRLSEDIKRFLFQKKDNQSQFTSSDLKSLCNILSIYPFGLSPAEIKLLEILSHEPCTLTCLAGKFNLDAGTVRKDVELYPLANRLFTINGKRQITPRGIEVLNSIKKNAANAINVPLINQVTIDNGKTEDAIVNLQC